MPPNGGPAGPERVNAFPVDGRYLVRHYFDGDRLFARIGRYYDNQQYRFEIPADEFADVRGFLADRGYRLVVVDDPTPYLVAVRKYTAHPDGIFKNAVAQRSQGDHNVFLLTDEDAVEDAVAADAARATDLGMDVPFDASVPETGDDDDEESEDEGERPG